MDMKYVRKMQKERLKNPKPKKPDEMLPAEDVAKVEQYIKDTILETFKTLPEMEIKTILTSRNPQKSTQAAKFVTIVEVNNKKLNIGSQLVFNTMKELRGMKQRDKYKHLKENNDV